MQSIRFGRVVKTEQTLRIYPPPEKKTNKDNNRDENPKKNEKLSNEFSVLNANNNHHTGNDLW